MIADGAPRRLHPLTLVLAVFRLGPSSLNMLPGLLALGFVGRWTYVVPALAAFLMISLGFSWLAWRRFAWQVDSSTISITSGIFSRNHRTIPFDRIQDVNIEQGPVQRVLELATVTFETGSAASGKADEGRLHAIAFADAAALRDHIRAHGAALSAAAGAGADGGLAVDHAGGLAGWQAGSGAPLLAMTPRRVLLSGLFNFSLAVIAVLFGLLNTFDNFLPIKPFSAEFWTGMLRGTGLEAWAMAHRWLSVIGGGVALVLLGMSTGVIRTVLRDWNFRLERGHRGFRRTRGLLTRTDVTIPKARVQAAIVEGGLVRRQFGWFALKLQSLASDGSGGGGGAGRGGAKAEVDHMAAPFATLAEVDAILAEMAYSRGSFDEDHHGWNGTHPLPILTTPLATLLIGLAVAAALWLLPRWMVLPADLPAGLASAPLLVAGLSAASAIFLLLLGWFQWRHARWHFDGRVLHIVHGFRNRQHSILPARNIQSADLNIGPLTRRFGLAGLRLGVPGGSDGQYVIQAMDAGAARALRAALLARRD